MEKELAKFIVLTAVRASTSLNGLLMLIKEHCTDSEYNSFLTAIGSVSGHIYSEIVQTAYDLSPDVEAEITATVDKYGIAM